jgi:5-methylcytosine-specific restriction endonuclease McrA
MADPNCSTKMCSRCGTLKPLTDFYGDKRGNIAWACKSCIRVYMASWREEHREDVQATHKRWRLANPETVKRNSIIDRAKHADRITAYTRRQQSKWAQRYAENKAALKAQVRAWQRANPDRCVAIYNRRRARKMSATGSFSASDVADIRRMQRDRCAFCRLPLGGGGHLDHIVALSKGGTNDRRNLQWLCQPCNASKHARDQIEFMRSRGLLL